MRPPGKTQPTAKLRKRRRPSPPAPVRAPVHPGREPGPASDPTAAGPPESALTASLLVGGHGDRAGAADAGGRGVLGAAAHEASLAALTAVALGVVLAVLGGGQVSADSGGPSSHPTPAGSLPRAPPQTHRPLVAPPPRPTHHAGARAWDAAVRVAVALAGDAATQKETFHVPVVAGSTFLGGHRGSDSEPRWTARWVVKGWQGPGATD